MTSLVKAHAARVLMAVKCRETLAGLELDEFARQVIAQTETGRAALHALEDGPHKTTRSAALAALVLAGG